MKQACERCGAKIAERSGVCTACPPELPPVRSILNGDIEILDQIGRGGMGTVWKGHDLRHGRFVAVKFLKAPEADPRAGLRFQREARSLARLDHPGIVSVFNFGSEDQTHFIVMELVDGRPLSELLPLPLERALALTIRIAEAVTHAHSHGIVHRDLKPANVLVRKNGEVKIADFGLARAIHPIDANDARLTRTGEFLGTPRYMAPELLDGAPPDPRIDVYSIGVLLREMIESVPEKAGILLPDLVQAVVSRATAVDPKSRYADASELLPDLWRAGGTLVGNVGPTKNRWPLIAALLAALAAASLWVAVTSGLIPRLIE